MEKKLAVVVLAALIVSGCINTPLQTTQNTTQSDPAADKCKAEGGGMDRPQGPGGPSFCLFLDGTACEQSAYLNGQCKKGDCVRTCKNTGTASEGWYDCNNKLIQYDQCNGETNKKTSC